MQVRRRKGPGETRGSRSSHACAARGHRTYDHDDNISAMKHNRDIYCLKYYMFENGIEFEEMRDEM